MADWVVQIGLVCVSAVVIPGVVYVASLGTRVAVVTSKQEDMKEWLERIEKKLDNALQQRK